MFGALQHGILILPSKNEMTNMKTKTTTRSLMGMSPKSVILLVAILVASTLGILWAMQKADHDMRGDLLRQAHLVAKGLDLAHVRMLSGTEADLSSPYYIQIKKQIAQVKQVNASYRFIYLLGRKPGGVFFFVDNEPPDSMSYSPPGQVYEEVPEGCLRTFITQTASVEGPFTDRWGTWVSAWVPMKDPQTGAIVALLGMDINASVWKWDVAAKAAMPVGLMLILLIGVIVAMAGARVIDTTPKPILRRLMPPLTAMIILLMVGGGMLLWQQHRQAVSKKIASQTSDAQSTFRLSLDQQATGLRLAAQPIANDFSVQKNLRNRDGDALLATWRPVFETLHQVNNITHLYFFDKNRVCILRVHKPEKRGDIINRFTAIEAERTGKAASGIELGPLGIFTLRVVQPVLEGDKLVGYVELGKEIEDVLQALRGFSGNELAVVIHKEHLNRLAWEDGMRLLGRVTDWDRLPHSVIIYASQGRLPDTVASLVDHDSTGSHAHGETSREVSFDGLDWSVVESSLHDASGKEVGYLLSMRDITVEKAAFTRMATLGGVFSVVLLTALLAFVFVLLRRTDAGIQAQRAELSESEERFRELVEHAPIGIFQSTPQGHFLAANPWLAGMYGYDSVQDLIECIQDINVQLYVDPEDRQRVKRLLERGPINIEVRQCSKDGSIIWVSLAMRTVYAEDGRILRYEGFARDNTKRKQAEDAIRESENVQRLIMESVDAGIVLIDPQTHIVELANSTAARMFGAPVEQIVGEVCHRFLCPAELGCCPITDLGHVVERAERVMLRREGGSIPVLKSVMQVRISNRNMLLETFVDISGQKRVEETLRQERLRLGNILDGTRAGTWEWNVQTGETVYNERWAQMVGYTLEELAPVSIETWTKLANPEDMKQATELLERHFSGELDSYDCKCRMKHKGGHWIWVHDRGQVITRTEDGKPLMMFGTHTDITASKNAHIALQEAEERYRNFFASVEAVKLIIDPADGAILDANAAAVDFYGYALEQLQKMFIYEVNMLPKEDVLSELGKASKLEKGHFFFNHRLANGEVRNVEVHTSAIQHKGKPLLMSSVHDITVSKMLEETLRESESNFRIFFESMTDMIMVSTLDGRLVFTNGAVEKQLGYSVDEMFSMHILDLHPVDMRKEAEDIFAAMLRGERDSCPLPLARKDGSQMHVETNIWIGRWSTQDCMFAFVRDITERRLSEMRLAEFASLMEHKNLELDEALAQATSASKTKGEFLANMSHEIRTPMNGVIGMTGLLLDTELTGEQRRYAETVRASAESLLSLINDILDLSKIEAGKLDLEALDFDLLNLLDDIVDTQAFRAHEKNLELLCKVSPETPAFVTGDPGRLRQILNNLIGNAIKFTKEGEIVIQVSLAEEQEADCVLCFSIRDTGIGIPEDKQSILFNKFMQADASTTRQYGGTGLGLAISKQLSEMMGGKIGVNSQAGQGSEFWFTVRLGKQPEGAQSAVLPSAEVLHGVRALVVDDNATNCEILSMRMNAWGMRPLEVQDGPTALQALYRALDEDDPYRVAVIDMQMPGMDGATLGRAIKIDPRLADVRMIMLTSVGKRGDARQFQELGFSAYGTKPVRHQDLFNILVNVLLGVPDTEAHSIVTRHSACEVMSSTTLNGRILLVEDNYTNQQVALGILKKFGIQADAVGNGVEALKALSQIPYDLVLMDMQMPVMDGIEATRTIRSQQANVLDHMIPIIAMTANAMQGDREKCLEAGMNDYVSKPVPPRSLYEKLELWLPKTVRVQRMDLEQSQNLNAGAKQASAQDQESVVFDKAGFVLGLMNDEELIQIVLNAFLDDMPRKVEALKKHVAAGDATNVELLAHTIKGASGQVGGKALSAVAAVVERLGKEGNTYSANDLLADLEIQSELLTAAIRQSFPDLTA